MSKPIVIDLLALSMCMHPSSRKPEALDEAYRKLRNANCWNKAEDVLRRSTTSRYPTRSVIYVSKRSLKNLQKALLSLVDAASQYMERLKPLRVIIQSIILQAERYGVVKPVTHRDPCWYTGFHAEEYCELAEALRKTIDECNFKCAIVCLDKTFSYDHLTKIARDVSTHDIAKGANARIVEVVKQ